MTSNVDKRRSPRKDCQVPVDCKKGTYFEDSQTVDISEGGVGLITSNAVPLDTTMAVEIALTPKGNPVLAMGQVKWVSQLPDSESYRIGLSFTDVASASMSRLAKYSRM